MRASLSEEAHLWLAEADSFEPPRLDEFRALLSSDEIERLLRFKVEPARREFLVAHGLLRELLGAYLAVDPASIRFFRGSHGKPGLAFPENSDLCFSLSHSHGRILVALSRGRALGVDIERHNPAVPETPGLLGTIFTGAERRELESLPAALRLRGFFCAWTRKEAYIKATGEGLSADLQSFSVSLDPRAAAVLKLRVPGEWTLLALDVGPEDEAAVVVSGGACPIRWFLLPCARGETKASP